MSLEAPETNDGVGGIDPASLAGLPSPADFLDQHRVQQADDAWIDMIVPDKPFPLKTFLQQPVLYYPGGGRDLEPVLLFYKHAGIRCFVNADYGDGGLGYLPGFQIRPQGKITLQDLDIHDWDELWHEQLRARRVGEPLNGSGAWVVHDPDTPDDSPIVSIYLKTEAIQTYFVLWARRGAAPDTVVLQDHGFGGNWNRFGAGGLLCEYTTDHALPRLLYVARNTDPWPRFVACSNLGNDGGQHEHQRAVFARAWAGA